MDSLAADPTALTPATVAGVLALTPPALIVGYGVARAGASLCNEARNAVFAQARRRGERRRAVAGSLPACLSTQRAAHPPL